MQAALLRSFNGPVAIEPVADPACPPHGVVIDIRACGVCRSDHHAWSGADPDVELPHVMGHELAGVVVDVGSECKRFSVGDRVTAPFILSAVRAQGAVLANPQHARPRVSSGSRSGAPSPSSRPSRMLTSTWCHFPTTWISLTRQRWAVA